MIYLNAKIEIYIKKIIDLNTEVVVSIVKILAGFIFQIDNNNTYKKIVLIK